MPVVVYLNHLCFISHQSLFIHNKSISSCCVDVVAGCENKIPMIIHMSYSNDMLGGGGHLMAKCGELHVGISVHKPADFSFACCELQKSPLFLTSDLNSLPPFCKLHVLLATKH